MSYGSSIPPSGAHDYQLGQQLRSLIAQNATSKLPFSAIFSQLQDLLGADTSLLGPLRDLLGRPALGQLMGINQQSVMVGGRDALLLELANTYNPLMVSRLAAVIDGCLGLAPGPVPSASPAGTSVAAPQQPLQAGDWPAPPPAQVYISPPAPQPTYVPQQTPIQILTSSPSSGPKPLTALLILFVSLLSGAVLLGLGAMYFSNRPQLNGSSPVKTPAAEPAFTSPPPPEPPPKDKEVTALPPETSSGAWGNSDEYKFGRLPGGNYPKSCAFTKTDDNGRATIDKSQLEYWACRDDGGNSENGYKVVWVDGKETTYTFQTGGDGIVVGTNGSTYPMTWRNDSHEGDPIIVIDHQDGSVSWIPGNISPPSAPASYSPSSSTTGAPPVDRPAP